MTFSAWLIFATFWAVFVTTPGPNAVNCVNVAMTYGLQKAVICVLAILTQACLFLALSAYGVTALLAASPTAFAVAKWIGAGFLIYLGVKGWITAGREIPATERDGHNIYIKALLIATINPKSFAGYFAAFTQFIHPDIPVLQQMWVIVPTALTLTSLSYLGYCALGAGLGRMATTAIMNMWVRRILAGCFVIYGILLGAFAQ
jgi:threonine/homoserine/homoserine lactone efflux protein